MVLNLMRQATTALFLISLLGCSDSRTATKSDSGSNPGLDQSHAADHKITGDQGPKGQKLKIVFVGNSLTFVNDLPRVLIKVAASATPPWTISAGQNHVPGASSLSSNWQSWGPASDRGTEALDLIKKVKPDLVVLQDQSSGPDVSSYPELWHAWIRGAGARTVLFMTWGIGDFGGPQFKMTGDSLEQAYNAAGQQTGATVAPVGSAWKAHYAKSKLKLHGGDALHPSPHGTYLAALVFFCTLTGQDPRGLSTGGLNISTTDAQQLQQTAWATYQANPMAVLAKQARTPPKDDHANTPAGATKMVLGKNASGTLGVADADVFSFDMTNSGKLSLTVQNSGKYLDLMVMDSQEKIIGRNNHASSKLTVADYYFKNLKEDPTLKSGKYYLRVSGMASGNKKVTSAYSITSQTP